tara:strand:- start:606 stop:2135 length:1530 start_codon:yes stop_codon:yes gene_type:complete
MNLIKSTGTFSLFTILSRILGYLRDFFIAIYLGSGPIADAFFVAFRIPNTFRRLFSEGTFNAAFIPSYTDENLKSKNAGKFFSNNVLNLLIIFLLLLVFVIEIFMPWFVILIAPGFKENHEKLDLVIQLTRITFPFLLFVSLSSFFSAILNSHNKFGAASAAPIILNIFLILVLFFGKYLDDKLVYYLSYAVTLAGIAQLFFLYFFVKKYYLPKINFKFKIDTKVKLFFGKLLPSIFSSGVTQINILIGTIIASFEASAVSYLYYADRIYQINLAIAGIAIGTVVLPKLSEYIKKNNIKKINFIQNKSLELSLFLSLPATIALLFAYNEITSSLFGYGSFDETSIKNAGIALFYFAFGLPAFALIKIFSSFLFARHNTKIPFYFSIFSVVINITLSLLFFNEYGFIIIPIATTISSWINAFILFIYLINEKYFTFQKNFFFSFIKILFSCVIMGLVFKNLINLFSENLIYSSNSKLFYMIIIILIAFTIYLITSIITKAFKISDINLKY